MIGNIVAGALTKAKPAFTVEYLVVAGGGGGGCEYVTGGGGAGGFRTATLTNLLLATNYTVTIGAKSKFGFWFYYFSGRWWWRW